MSKRCRRNCKQCRSWSDSPLREVRSESALFAQPVCRKHGLSGHCPAGVLECGSMDNVHRVHGQCSLSQWTLSTQSMDNDHSVHGQCPLRPWTMSTESIDWCPLSPWTVTTQSMDNVRWDHGQCPLNAVTNVHSVHGLFPWVLPTLYLVKHYSNPTKLNAYIQFTVHVIYISWHAYMSINTDKADPMKTNYIVLYIVLLYQVCL